MEASVSGGLSGEIGFLPWLPGDLDQSPLVGHLDPSCILNRPAAKLGKEASERRAVASLVIDEKQNRWAL